MSAPPSVISCLSSLPKLLRFLSMFSLITSPAECFSFKCHPLITDWCDLTQRESASRSVSSPRLEGLSLVCVCVWLGSRRHHSVLKKTKSGPLTFGASCEDQIQTLFSLADSELSTCNEQLQIKHCFFLRTRESSLLIREVMGNDDASVPTIIIRLGRETHIKSKSLLEELLICCMIGCSDVAEAPV